MENNYILAIDPGNIESAYCLINDKDYSPIEFGKVNNDDLLTLIIPRLLKSYENTYALVVEMIASYGMPVGASVFDTCVWIGRFYEATIRSVATIEYIYRKEEKINLCNSMKAKDSNIRQALIDRFGDVGTKKNKGFFYGFKKDIWSAFAVGCTYLDKQKKNY